MTPKHGAAKRLASNARATAVRQASRLYATSHKVWRAHREQQLNDYPLCKHCMGEGRITPATDVDHVNGRADRAEDYTPDNYQSLCKSCHSIKTADENAGHTTQEPRAQVN